MATSDTLPDGPVTVEDVTSWVTELPHRYQGPSGDWDDEGAHERENWIHRAVLCAIAEGRCSDPAGCARVALGTSRFDFGRWCA